MGRAAASEHPTPMTLEQWAALDEDVEGELIDGLLEEEEMPSILHETVVVWLSAILSAWARRRHGLVTGSETKIAVGPRRGRKPDISVFLSPFVPGPSETLVRLPAHLTVEIVSPRPRDARRDRIDKLNDYARAKVKHYAVLDPQVRGLEVYELGRDGRYTVALSASRGRVRVPGCPGLVLDLDALWDEVNRAERAHAHHAHAARRRR